MNIVIYLLYFFIYAFLGWICESIFCSIGNKKIINRGFLNGPICPIYGFGAIIIICFLTRFQNNIVLLFLFGVLITSILEYMTGYILEKIFNTKWWDYSNRKFNIKGRVCLRNSILFGIMGIFLIKFIHNSIIHVVSIIPNIVILVIVSIISIYLIVDITVTLKAMKRLNIKLNALDDMTKELRTLSLDLENLNGDYDKIIHLDSKNKLDELRIVLNNIINKSKLQKRIIDAFPTMEHKKYYKQFRYLKRILQTNKKSRK